ncbi:MAG: M20/M25/M40 family metallo-hydrolase [Rhodothermales bacterium]|nr:M20/M25/M40 family metallo-hydrolase [Rhodothermales bacterium]
MIDATEIVGLHRILVELPSVSGNEEGIADFVEGWLKDRCRRVHRIGNSVVALHGDGPYLLLNSHLDTVPVCEGWSREPYDARVENGVVFGLGSNDAKGAAAAMMTAFDFAINNGNAGAIALALVEGEETTGKGMTATLEFVRANSIQIAAAVIGEPTNLEIAVAQKGLLILELVAESTPCHAARATQLGVENPILALAEDIVAVGRLTWPDVDPFLGPLSLQPTIVQGGTARNQVPGIASAILDIRSTNAYSHDEIIQRIQKTIRGRLNTVSSRLEPVATPESANIVSAARTANPESEIFGSATMSDMVFVKGIPAVKVGPGVSERSHTPDEYISTNELVGGASFYVRLIQEFHKLENAKNENKRVIV